MSRQIPRWLADEYNRKIKLQGDAAEKYVEKLLRAFLQENPDATADDARDFAFELMQAAGDLYGNACSQAALDLQYEIAEMFGARPPDIGGWLYEPDPDSIAATAQKHAKSLEEGDVEGFVRGIREGARYYAERGANSTMAQTARKQAEGSGGKGRRKGKSAYGVRFARVPMGPTNCDLCIMLASRGFVYLSKESAGEFDQYHPHCDCRIIPSYGDATLEGYDPGYYLDCYEHPEDHPEISDARNARRRALYAEHEMFKLARVDSATPLGERRAKRLANLFGRAMDGRKELFRQELTEENYARTVEALLKDIGKVYGMNIKGECLIGEKLHSAIPDGYEIWAATRMGGYFEELQFLGEDRRRRRGNPDLLADGIYMDIKTPVNPDKIGKNLTYASTQCRNRGQSAGVAILSPLRLKSRPEECLRTANSWVNQARISKVYVLGGNSSVIEI